MADKLATLSNLTVVGDHKVYLDIDHERKLRYRDRVEEILKNCSGMVIILPRKTYSQTTAPFIFLELLLAIKHNLPVLLVCEEGVKLAQQRSGDQLLFRFGAPSHSEAPLSVDDLKNDDFRVDSLKFAHSIEIRTTRFFNDPFYISGDPSAMSGADPALSSLIEEFTSVLDEPKEKGYVFNIMPYSKSQERLIVAAAVYQETGLACINGSDAWAGAPFSREEICEKIKGATFVIADLTGASKACVFEVGVAIGSSKSTFVITRTPRASVPFGVDILPRLAYKSDMELDAAVRNHCRPYRRRNFNFELSQRKIELIRERDGQTRKPVVLLVHGIRTQAEWQEKLRREVLLSEGIQVIPIKYGFFDSLRFWFPFWTRKGAISTLKWKLEKAISMNHGNDIVVIAHSFGTYAVSRILKDDLNFRPTRILFCGSIIGQNFRWDRIENCPPIVNDCGARDVWPALATALSWGYGASGVFGFGTPGIQDRHHNFKHSDYFSESFMKEYWHPWIKEGRVIQSGYEGMAKSSPYWMSLVTVNSFRLFILFLVLFIVYGVAF
ncbi:hypothetical protein ACGFY7_31415 [Streptomyces prunicolor]|uniref:hypothetical protein n=1 Tax=Streptomyces prunicolor TaxID=67348 RepID=UPI00371CE0C2